MSKPWSLSTTVRIPERAKGFLEILKKYIEGKVYNKKAQIEYIIRLIQHKKYKPFNLTVQEQKSYRQEPEVSFSFEKAKKIFERQNYTDPSMRGRTASNPLMKLGLCIARESLGEVKILNMGEALLSNQKSYEEIFLNFFIKWQLPNPLDKRSFSRKRGFCINPFIATLKIIEKVNRLWEKEGEKAVGINRNEFNLFVPTTIHYKQKNGDLKQMRDVWDFPLCQGKERIKDENNRALHPNQKPKKLIERLILASSHSDDLVLDPFLGVGTTAVMAEKHNRKWIGIEKEEKYVEAAKKRIDNYC